MCRILLIFEKILIRMQDERLPNLIMEWIPGERRKKEDVQEKCGWKLYEQP